MHGFIYGCGLCSELQIKLKGKRTHLSFCADCMRCGVVTVIALLRQARDHMRYLFDPSFSAIYVQGQPFSAIKAGTPNHHVFLLINIHRQDHSLFKPEDSESCFIHI